MAVSDDQIVLNKGPLVLKLSSIKYTAYLLAGVASLWPWNCFLSASDYFQERFGEYPYLSSNYSSMMMTVSTLVSTCFNFYLSRRQKGVNYSDRLKRGNNIQILVFIIMALFVLLPQKLTIFYFVFVMVNVAFTSVGSCLTQVGLMALVNTQSSFYANATVVGNAIAGVLPSISMIVAVLANESQILDITQRSGEAIKYFLTSVAMAILAQLSIWGMEYYESKYSYLDVESVASLSNTQATDGIDEEEEGQSHLHKDVGFMQLWSKLNYIESTIMLTFSITLVFPIFASNVESKVIDKKIFTPLAFLVWNLGDLLGRIICAIPQCVVKSNFSLITYSLLRIAFIPLFLLCNIKGRGNDIFGDVIYMGLQLLFGLTNGQLFSSAYMRVGEVLDTEDEQKAAAAFTALVINISLLGGALFSFIVVLLCK